MTTIEARETTASGHQLRVYESGDPDRTTILWLHGGRQGDSALSNWSAQISSMPDWHHVAPERPESSERDRLLAPLGVLATVELRLPLVLGLLEQLGRSPVHVVASGLGALIALRLLMEVPEQLDRAVLVPGAAEANPPEPTCEVVTDRPKGMTPPLFSPRQLRSITHEVLVVHGREDRPAAREQALCLAQHLPNAQLHMFPHAGHWVQIEQVDRFRALVEMFLTEAPSPVTHRPLSTAGRHPSGR